MKKKKTLPLSFTPFWQNSCSNVSDFVLSGLLFRQAFFLFGVLTTNVVFGLLFVSLKAAEPLQIWPPFQLCSPPASSTVSLSISDMKTSPCKQSKASVIAV